MSSNAETAASVSAERSRIAGAATRPAVIKAISDAVDFAVCELRDARDADSTHYVRLLSRVQDRWPVLDCTDRAFVAGYASGVIDGQKRVLATVPVAAMGTRQ